MPTTDKEFLIRVRADIQQAVGQMNRIAQEIDKQGKTANKAAASNQKLSKSAGQAAANIQKQGAAAKSTAASTQKMGQSVQFLTSTLGAYVGIASLIQGLKLADQFNVLQVRLKTATRATGDYNEVAKETYAIAQRNGTQLKVTVDTFQSLQRSAEDLGASNTEILKVTEAVQQLGILSGASTQAMSAGLLQFSQGLASGTLRAEEMNSILENIPEVAVRIADGMGLSVGELRKAVIEGKILSKDVFDTLLKQASEIDNEMQEIPLSLQRATNLLVTSTGNFLSSLDQASGVTAGIAETFKLISRGMDAFAQDINPTGQQKLNQLVAERISLLEEQAKLEQDIWSGLVDFESASGRASQAYADQLNNRIKLLTKEIELIQDAGIEQEKTGKAGQGATKLTADEQKRLAEQLDSVKNKLMEQVSLFDQQRQAVEAAQQRAADFDLTTQDAREELTNTLSPEQSTPGVLDISGSVSKANDLLESGDFEGAQAQAEETYKIIQAVAEAGTAAKITLNDYFASVQDIGSQASQALVDSEKAAFEQVKSEITDLLGEAQKLTSLKVGLDDAEATQQATALRASLQAQFDQNPLVLPVILQKPDTGLTKQVDDALEALPAKAGGGPIRGPGTGTSDDVLMWGSNGEFVLRAAAVRHYGLDALQRINRIQAPRFADGGLIGAASPGINISAPAAPAQGRPITLVLDGQSYAMSTPESTAQILERELLRASNKTGYRIR